MLQLPVIESVKDAVGYTMSNIALLIKASLFWVALYTILVAVFSFTGGDEFMQILASFAEYEVDANAVDPLAGLKEMATALGKLGGFTNILYLIMMLIGVMAYYSIAIAWHRACLLDETPPLVRLGRLEFKYFGYTILLGVVLYLIFVILGVAVGFIVALFSAGDSLDVAYALIGVLGILLFLTFGRFSLAFPGIAVRDRRMNLRTSWKYTKGNSWRILGGTILCIIPALVISLISSLIGNISLPLVIYLPIVMVLQLLSGAFLLSYMSICYQFLVPSPDEGDLA